MIETASPALDFAALDDLAFAAARGRLNGRPLPIMIAREIGPILELAQLSDGGLLPAPSVSPFLSLNGLSPMVQALCTGNTQWICPQSRMIGFLRSATSFPQDETIWTAFGLATQQAATAAGFPRKIAAQLTAALGELHSNVYEHSKASDTGVVAFHAQPGRFELVVSDRGIGVLESLRGSPDYADLSDHGEALRLTLTDGVSRFGINSGRGLGFRPLFIGLANLNGALRFRSGDHALVIDGRGPSLVTARTAQKPAIRGFLVSVSCLTHGIT
ncbi:ATP-binding protein [Rhizobium sp. 2YAF20]|uniref:ATP-binding protein n=1 Tax=Rhizobium sp. 2YAF20 TaxID=3233027 RepID=UPI003F97871D